MHYENNLTNTDSMALSCGSWEFFFLPYLQSDSIFCPPQLKKNANFEYQPSKLSGLVLNNSPGSLV